MTVSILYSIVVINLKLEIDLFTAAFFIISKEVKTYKSRSMTLTL